MSHTTERGELRRALGLSAAQAGAALDAAWTVARARGPEGPRGTSALAALALSLGRNLGEARTIEAVALGAVFPSARERVALLQGLVLIAAIEGSVDPAAEGWILDAARELGVRSHWVDLLPALRRRRVWSIKRQLYARSPDGRRILARTWSEDGIAGMARALLFVVGVEQDRVLAARFRSLGSLPNGSFGRAFFDHIESRGLSFPGERGGVPEKMVHHDLMHVLNGYDTDAAGECELAAFYAAFADGDAFTFLMTALATFQLGLAVSPAIVEVTTGAFDPHRMIAAFLRGRRLRADVMGRWDYWPLLELDLAEARARLGVGAMETQDDSR